MKFRSVRKLPRILNFILLIDIVGCQRTPNSSVIATSEEPLLERGTLVEGTNWFQSVALTINGIPFCSGVMIDSRTILTAAHCVKDANTGFEIDLSKIQVYFGSYTNEAPQGFSLRPDRLSIHPQYDSSIRKNDLAKLYFDQNIPITQGELVKRPFPQLVNRENINQLLGQEEPTIYIVGYGRKNHQGDPPSAKREVRGTIAEVPDSGFLIVPTHHGFTCPGDSGCPAFVKGRDQKLYLLGIFNGSFPLESSQKLGYDGYVSLVTPFEQDCWSVSSVSLPSPVCKKSWGSTWSYRGRSSNNNSTSIRCALVQNHKGLTPVPQSSSKICITPLRPVRTQLIEMRPRAICN